MLRFLNMLLRRLGGCRRGATAVEFGILLPTYLIMVLGVVEVGRALWIKSSLQFACEKAARYAIVNTSASTSTVANYALTRLANTGINTTGVTFSAVQDTTGSVTFVTISGTYNFTVLVNIVPMPDVTLTAISRVPLG